MFIEDGSDIDYDSKEPLECRYSWGWIGNNINADRSGWADQPLKSKVVARLQEIMDITHPYSCSDGETFEISTHCVKQHMGHHVCKICCPGRAEYPIPERADIHLGWNGSILIEYKGKEFRCPWAVIHYITRHDYCPPEEVVDALFYGRVRTDDEVQKEWDQKLRDWRLAAGESDEH